MLLQKKIFFKGIVWRLAFYVSSLLLNIYLSNTLGASQTGLFFYLINNLSIAVQFLTMGLDMSLSYFNAKKEFKQSALTSIALRWTVLTTALFTLLFLLGLLFDFFSNQHNTLLVILFVFSSILTGLTTALFVSSNQHVVPSIIPLLGNLFLITYLYLLNLNSHPDLLNQFIKAYFIASALVCLSLFLILYVQSKPSINLWPLRLNKEIVTYSTNIFLFNMVVSLLLRGDIWLVRYMADNKDLGNYIQTGKIVQLILLLPNLASFTLLPLLTQQTSVHNDVKADVVKLSRIYFLVSLVLCCALGLTGYWLFPFLFGQSFNKMYQAFMLLTPGILFFSASYPIDTFFSSINRNKVNIQAAFLALSIMLVVDLVLIPRYSIYGAAMGSSVSFTFFYLYLWYQFKRAL